MATEQTVDVEAFLNPIEGDEPCGPSLRFDPLYDEIKKARSRDDKSAIEQGSAPAPPDWALVIRKASGAIQTRSKDLMFGADLLEALSEQHGFAGFRDGMRVLNGLLERFWDGLHPQMAEGDFERRLPPLEWLTDADRGGRIPEPPAGARHRAGAGRRPRRSRGPLAILLLDAQGRGGERRRIRSASRGQ